MKPEVRLCVECGDPTEERCERCHRPLHPICLVSHRRHNCGVAVLV